jgi:dipeptidyl aminopeptidase/acylaminoacyl peptidase
MRRIRTPIVLPFFIFLVAATASVAPAQGFTLEQVMSAPFPSQMTAAPAGGRFAWVQNDRGARNVWVAAPPDYRGRQLTAYTRDDGQDIGGIAWTPDGRTILYVRGGGANRAGQRPNPTSDPAGVEQAIWRIFADGGQPVKVAAGASPAVSPKGDGVAFTRGGQVWWAPLGGPKQAEATQLVNARGNAGSLRWSPDGARLAFVSGRGDHAFVGVYDVAAKALRWMAPSVDEDGAPAWSPDGARLAVLRVPASSAETTFRPVREAFPWSILVADPATGQARTAWTAQAGRGSAFRDIVADDQLMWGAGDRLVFPWERDGWTHLYSVAAAGGQAALLTPGEFEVEYAALSPDRREVVFNSNQGDLDRRHLWRVGVGGGPPRPVTRGQMIEWDPALASDGRTLAFFRSGAREPPAALVMADGGAARELAPGTVPADFPFRALVEPQPVVITAADGMQVHAQLFAPRGSGRHPAVVFFHGGSRRQMLLGWHYGDYYRNAYALNQYLASRGYVVLAVNYRSGIGYGMEFREALNYGAAGASEVADVFGAGLYLRSRPDVDPARIGAWGGSYGGFLTAMALARAPDLFAAGVDFHGVHDWNTEIPNFQPSYDSLRVGDLARQAFQSSPMAYLDSWRAPVLVIHGDDDRNVPFSETVRLVEELRKRNVPVEQLVFPDEIHGFLTHAAWVRAYHATADFLDRRLKGAAGASASP